MENLKGFLDDEVHEQYLKLEQTGEQFSTSAVFIKVGRKNRTLESSLQSFLD